MILVIADDFTGSCDAGVQFSSVTQHCPIYFDFSPESASKVFESANAGPVSRQFAVMDTESRHLLPTVAAERVAAAADFGSRLNGRSDPIVLFKKIDSTLRGNISSELEALRRAYPERKIIVAPAFPATGRTTINGICYVDGVPLADTEFSHDSRNPVASSSVKAALSQASDITYTVLSRPDGIASLIEGAASDDHFIVDATTDEELSAIVEELQSVLHKVILVGSAGLAAALRRTVFPNGDEIAVAFGGSRSSARPPAAAPPAAALPRRTRKLDARDGIVLGIVGSRSERSKRQLSVAIEGMRCDVVPLRMARLELEDADGDYADGDYADGDRADGDCADGDCADGDCADGDCADGDRADGDREDAHSLGSPWRIAERTLEALRTAAERASILLITVPDQPAEVATPDHDDVARLLGKAAQIVQHERRIGGLFLSGGDVASAVARALGANAARICGELEPGVPIMVLSGRGFEIVTVTKAGGFGRDAAIRNALDALSGSNGHTLHERPDRPRAGA